MHIKHLGVCVLGVLLALPVYSDKEVRIEQPDQIIYAVGFESNEQMTRYKFYKTNGIFYIDEAGAATPSDSLQVDTLQTDTVG